MSLSEEGAEEEELDAYYPKHRQIVVFYHHTLNLILVKINYWLRKDLLKTLRYNISFANNAKVEQEAMIRIV